MVRTSRLSRKQVDQVIKMGATGSEDSGLDIWNIGRARTEGAEIMVRYVLSSVDMQDRISLLS